MVLSDDNDDNAAADSLILFGHHLALDNQEEHLAPMNGFEITNKRYFNLNPAEDTYLFDADPLSIFTPTHVSTYQHADITVQSRVSVENFPTRN